jgi:hypothetical protein
MPLASGDRGTVHDMFSVRNMFFWGGRDSMVDTTSL